MYKINKEERDKVKLALLTVFCNATQIYRRTIPKNKKDAYKKKVKEVIISLIEKIDNNSIQNKNIRQAIQELSDNVGISIGASQKAVNVYLKVYCIVSNKDDKMLRELDCPIDSKVIKKNKLKKISLKVMNLEDYEEMQRQLQQSYGIKILADIKAWDSEKVYK